MTDFSTQHILLHIYHADNFLYVIDFRHISHVEKLLRMSISHMEKFLNITIFFSTSTACGSSDKYQVCLDAYLLLLLSSKYKC